PRLRLPVAAGHVSAPPAGRGRAVHRPASGGRLASLEGGRPSVLEDLAAPPRDPVGGRRRRRGGRLARRSRRGRWLGRRRAATNAGTPSPPSTATRDGWG